MDESSVVKESLTTALDGKNYRTKIANIVCEFFKISQKGPTVSGQFYKRKKVNEISV